jgi:hypothetical protein
MIRSLTADIRWYQLLDSKGASVVISRVYREVAWLIKPGSRAYGGSHRIHFPPRKIWTLDSRQRISDILPPLFACGGEKAAVPVFIHWAGSLNIARKTLIPGRGEARSWRCAAWRGGCESVPAS